MLSLSHLPHPILSSIPPHPTPPPNETVVLNEYYAAVGTPLAVTQEDCPCVFNVFFFKKWRAQCHSVGSLIQLQLILAL